MIVDLTEIKMEPGYRQLGIDDELKDGDEWFNVNRWSSTTCSGLRIDNTFAIYRRKIESSCGLCWPDSSCACTKPAVDNDAVSQLRVILDKEQEHIALVAQGNSLRDKTLSLGQSLGDARKQFGTRFRDRKFVIGGRLVDTLGGKFESSPVELVEAR